MHARVPSRIHVLLVEADAGDAELARVRLADDEGDAFRVSAVTTLAGAMDVLSVATPDVVLTDLVLPDSDDSAVTTLRQALPSTPIVVVTGREDSDAGLTAMRAGADAFLHKEELTTGLLTRTLRHAIERRHTQRELVENIADGVLVLVRDREIRFANPAAIDLLGRPESQLLGRSIDLPTLPGGRTEVQLGAPGSDERTVEVSTRAIEWYGQPANLVTLRDVTEQRRSDALRARLAGADRLAAMGQLAASMAHEINNALAVLKINLPMLQQMLGAAGATDDMTESAGDCGLAVARIEDIVREMRAYSKEGSDRHVVVRAVDPNEVVRDAVRLMGPQVRQNARLDVSLGDVPSISSDAGELSQIVVNLLRNAVDAIADSAEPAVISIATSREPGGVRIRVCDNGPGIPDEIRSRIFEPFFTTKSATRNTGLGLAVVADLLRRRGGSIQVTSTPGQPTQFEVLLPHDVVTVASPRPHVDATGRIARARILLVEDDRSVRAAVSRSLGGAREVVEADGGSDALGLLEQNAAFDAIVCDVMMPEMDGAAFYAQLCARFPALVSRVVFVTGGANSDRTRKLLASNVRVIQKPVDPGKLLTAVDTVLAAPG